MNLLSTISGSLGLFCFFMSIIDSLPSIKSLYFWYKRSNLSKLLTGRSYLYTDGISYVKSYGPYFSTKIFLVRS